MTTNTEETTEAKKPPVVKRNIGLSYVSIWQRVTEKGVFYSATFERRYKDGKGKWQSTQSFNLEDLPAFSKLADLALLEIIKLETNQEA